MQTYYHAADAPLQRLNPLSKLLAIAPVAIFIALTTEPWTPLVFSVFIGLVILGLGRVPLRLFARVAIPTLIFTLGFVLLYPLFVRRELVDHTSILLSLGPVVVYLGSVHLGAATALRIAALLMLSALFTLTTDSSDFIRALVQQWHLPYRIGYSALAAFRFVPMLQSELNVIRAAHRVRGISDKSGLRAQYDRLRRYAVPLLATAIRRAERTALAMDGRAFGAYDTRTYFRRMAFGRRDVIFIVAFWLACAAIVVGLQQFGVLGPLVMLRSV